MKALFIFILFIMHFRTVNNTTGLANHETSWEIIKYDENFALLKYHLSDSDKVSMAKKAHCYKNGWINCNFLLSSNVKILKDGTAYFSFNKYTSDFPADTTPYKINWEIKKSELNFKNELIASIQDSVFIRWVSK